MVSGLEPQPYFKCGAKMFGELERSFPDCFKHAAFVIFSHDFAKAFWHDIGSYYDSRTGKIIPYWQYHFLKMALEEEPLKYLEEFL
jgi:hypothetical protein